MLTLHILRRPRSSKLCLDARPPSFPYHGKRAMCPLHTSRLRTPLGPPRYNHYRCNGLVQRDLLTSAAQTIPPSWGQMTTGSVPVSCIHSAASLLQACLAVRPCGSSALGPAGLTAWRPRFCCALVSGRQLLLHFQLLRFPSL